MKRIRLHFHHTQFQWSGVPSRYVQLVDHIDRSRFSCSVCAAPDVVDNAILQEWQLAFRELTGPDMRRQNTPWHNFNDLLAETATFQLGFDGKVDVVHFLDGEHSGSYLPKLPRQRMQGLKVIASFHQPPELAEKVICGESLRHLDAVILVSPSQVPYFRRFVPPERIHVILHGVDTKFFRPSRTRAQTKQLRCITTGLHLRDWDAFHEVASAMPEVGFQVVTSNRVNLRPLPNVQVFTGIDDSVLSEYYRSADVLYLPLQDATANNSLLEGMASGLPVVSTDLESVRAYVPSRAGFLIARNDTQGTVAAIAKLSSDVNLRTRMAKAARTAAEQLAWGKVVEQYQTVYRSVWVEKNHRSVAIPMTRLPDLVHGASLKTISPDQNDLTLISTPTQFKTFTPWIEQFLRQGLVGEAAMMLQSLVVTAPQGCDASWARAVTAEYEWRWRDAERHWSHFIRSCPEEQRMAALIRKASCQAEASDLPAAGQTFASVRDSCEELRCSAALASRYASSKEALAIWKNYTILYPDQVSGFIGLASELLAQAQFDTADSLLNHARRVWPDDPELWILWASTAVNAGNVERAESRWSQVIARHGYLEAISVPYAWYLGISGKARVRDAFMKDANLNAKMQSEFLLSYYVAACDWASALDAGRQTVNHSIRDPSRRERYARLLLRQGSSAATDEAVEILSELHRISPRSAVVVPALARAFIAKEAAEAALALIESMPPERTDPKAESLRLWSRMLKAKNVEALRAWRAAFVGFGFLANELDLSPAG